MPDGTATAHLYRPKLATTLGEGYGLAAFTQGRARRADGGDRRPAALDGDRRGLRRLARARPLHRRSSAASWSRRSAAAGFQIGGPAGAFIVLVAATVARFGVEGLLLTVLLSGVMLTLVGVARLGSLIRHIPHAVTVGFTCGIAVTILASQLKDLGGLQLAGAEPGPLIPKLAALAGALPTVRPGGAWRWAAARRR